MKPVYYARSCGVFGSRSRSFKRHFKRPPRSFRRPPHRRIPVNLPPPMAPTRLRLHRRRQSYTPSLTLLTHSAVTLVGSVANMIVAERARTFYKLGFWEYLRFGFPSTLLNVALGGGLIYLLPYNHSP